MPGKGQSITFSSPNAATLSIFNQYPQSSFTGVPAINIPVYNFSYQELALPITLNYNNNAVRPNTYASWVGLGWNLNVAGAITRVVNDKPDDQNWYNPIFEHATNDHLVGYYYNYGYLHDGSWDTPTNIENAILDYRNYTVSGAASLQIHGQTIRDYSPDEFSFSVGNISGTFYLNDQRQWQVRSTSQMQVSVSFSSLPSYTDPTGGYTGGSYTYPARTYFRSITLTDTKGIKYVFGGDGNALEWSKRAIKTWNLTSIIFPNGKTITYSYEFGKPIEQFFPQDYDSGPEYVSETSTPSYLKSIQTDLHTINFYRSKYYAYPDTLEKLDSITVNDVVNKQEKQKLAFSYHTTSLGRLKLDGTAQKDYANQAAAQYGFTYNATQFTTTLPLDSYPYIGNSDFWGYYSTIPLAAGSSSNYFASRVADTANCRAELLDKIIYPTGGHSVYTWEPNDCSSMIANDRTTLTTPDYTNLGGARIKQITSFDQSNNRLSSKKYSYMKNYTPTQTYISSGVSYQPITAWWHGVNYYSYNFILPGLLNNASSHVSYSEVTEIKDDGGYTTINYSNFDNGIMDEASLNSSVLVPFTAPLQFSYNVHERGFPLTEKSYTSASALVNKKTFNYTRIYNTGVTGSDYVRTYIIDNNPSIPFWAGSAVKIYTNAYLPSSVTDSLYSNSQLITAKTTNYTYDGITLNTNAVSSTNSKGEATETDNRYPSDMVSLSLDPTGVYSDMVSNNIISPLITSINKIGGTVQKTQQTSYENVNTIVFKPLQTSLQYGSNSSRTVIADNAYDPVGNLLSASKLAGSPTSYIYGYNKNLPIAQVTNAINTECFYDGFEDSGIYGIAHTGHRYAPVPYYLGFVIPNSRSYIISYWYRVSGVWYYESSSYTNSITGHTYTLQPSNMSADAVDDIRIYPVDAQMTTYTYDPLSGMTSMTDVKNLTTYYEYDGVQRLKNIKDQDGNIVKSICYNYAGASVGCGLNVVYSNYSRSDTYTASCDPDYIGSSVGYSVAAGIYHSTISQADADQQALSESLINGPVKATQTGTCTVGSIYARVEVENIETHDDDTYADVFVRFYSDAACTNPYSLPSSMDVAVGIQYEGSDTGIPPDQIVTYSASSNEIQIGYQMAVSGAEDSGMFYYYFNLASNASPYTPESSIGETY